MDLCVDGELLLHISSTIEVLGKAFFMEKKKRWTHPSNIALCFENNFCKSYEKNFFPIFGGSIVTMDS